MARCLLLIALVVLPVVVRAQSDSRSTAPAPYGCPVTVRPIPSFVPPEPYLQKPADGEFWYGTEGLWTWLVTDGRWHGLPHNENGYRQKVFFWHRGYDWGQEPHPALTITGRRLDGETLPLHLDDYANMAFVPSRAAAAMVTAFEVPTLGCWELTAQYHSDSLTFVVWVSR